MVVAIIALLVSLLMPAVQRGVKLARRGICLSNLHQMGLAGHGYKAAHHCFPAENPGVMGLPAPLEAWPQKFLAYAKSPDLFWCPSSPEWMRWDGEPFPQRYGATPFSYGLLVWGPADSAYLGWWVRSNSAMPGRTDKEIARPSDFYWLSDSNGGTDEDPLGAWDLVTEIHLFDWCNPAELPGARHLDGTNVLYADGHSVWHHRDGIYQAELLPVGSPRRRMWRRKGSVDNLPHEEYTN